MMEEKVKIADTVLGVFPDHDSADGAVKDLQAGGFETKDISVIMRGPKEGEIVTKKPKTSLIKGVVTDAGQGAGTGAIIGGLAGLLIGIVAIAVPGFGFLLFAGPLAEALGLGTAVATTLTGVLAGAAGGGLIGAFTGLGVPGKEAAQYAERLQAGAVIIGVTIKPEQETEVANIMTRNGAEEVRTLPVKG
ncbi:MAG TPA: hypothetical protein VMW04_00630 [Patescibacteria group bacterium]|nr:hypothetical protein [Patescibacteria group bacterium]